MSETIKPASVDQLNETFYQILDKLRGILVNDPNFIIADLGRTVYYLIRAARREGQEVESGMHVRSEESGGVTPAPGGWKIGDKTWRPSGERFVEIAPQAASLFSAIDDVLQAAEAQQKAAAIPESEFRRDWARDPKCPYWFDDEWPCKVSMEHITLLGYDVYEYVAALSNAKDIEVVVYAQKPTRLWSYEPKRSYEKSVPQEPDVEKSCDSSDRVDDTVICGEDPTETIRVSNYGQTVIYRGQTIGSDEPVLIDWDAGMPRVTLTLVADRIIVE